MKSLLQCVECTKSGSVQPYLFVGDYYDGHTVEATCPLGHAAFSIVQNPKFETLLTAAADALIHDQTLQAVACLAASRERLFELAIRVFARSSGVDPGNFEASWKEVASQSERQFGAFLFLYLAATGKPYEFDKKLATARNAALHKGEIPTTGEAFDYAGKVYQEISNLANYLRTDHKESLRAVLHEENMRKAGRAPKGVPVVTIALFSIYRIEAEENRANFKEAFDQYRDWLPALPEVAESTQKASGVHTTRSHPPHSE